MFPNNEVEQKSTTGIRVISYHICLWYTYPDSKVNEANMGPPGANRTQVGPGGAYEPCYLSCYDYDGHSNLVWRQSLTKYFNSAWGRMLCKCNNEVLCYKRTICHMSRMLWKRVHHIGTLLICSDWPTSSWWLQMVWHKRGTRPSKTMLMWLCLMSQHGSHYKNTFYIIIIKKTLYKTGW